MSVSSLCFFFTVKIFRQTVIKLSRLRVHTAPTQMLGIELRYGFKFQRLAFRFRFKLLRLALRFHIFSCRYRVNATPNRKNFVFRLCQHRVNGVLFFIIPHKSEKFF